MMQNLLVFTLFLTEIISTVSGSALTTIIPCPACPARLAPPAITVTAQYQPVSTCTTSVSCRTNTFSLCSPSAACSTTANSTCSTAVPCSTSLWVSTIIPCVSSNKANQSCTITATDQLVTISQETETSTSTSYYTTTYLSTSYLTAATQKPHTFAKDRRYNGPELKGVNWTPKSSTVSIVKTIPKFNLVPIVRDFIVRFSQIGPMAIPGYGGSGICTTCGSSSDGSVEQSQPVVIRTCIKGVCSSVKQVWVSHIVTITVPHTQSYVREVHVSSNGLQTLTVAPQITATTYISSPTTIAFAGTSQVVSENGVHTVTMAPESYTTVVVHNAPTTINLPSGIHTISTNGAHILKLLEAIFFTYVVHNAPFTAYFPATINIYQSIGHYTITLAHGVYITTIINNAPGTVTISTTVTTTVTTTTTATSTASPVTTPTTPTTTTGPSPISTPIQLNGKVWSYNSCASPSAGSEFSLVLSSGSMTPTLCLSTCTSYNYGGIHGK